MINQDLVVCSRFQISRRGWCILFAMTCTCIYTVGYVNCIRPSVTATPYKACCDNMLIKVYIDTRVVYLRKIFICQIHATRAYGGLVLKIVHTFLYAELLLQAIYFEND